MHVTQPRSTEINSSVLLARSCVAACDKYSFKAGQMTCSLGILLSISTLNPYFLLFALIFVSSNRKAKNGGIRMQITNGFGDNSNS